MSRQFLSGDEAFAYGVRLAKPAVISAYPITPQTVVVEKLLGEGAVKRRIMDMGITKGTEIYVRKVAPLGDPVEITVRGYELSVRKADAQMVEVK